MNKINQTKEKNSDARFVILILIQSHNQLHGV